MNSPIIYLSDVKDPSSWDFAVPVVIYQCIEMKVHNRSHCTKKNVNAFHAYNYIIQAYSHARFHQCSWVHQQGERKGNCSKPYSCNRAEERNQRNKEVIVEIFILTPHLHGWNSTRETGFPWLLPPASVPHVVPGRFGSILEHHGRNIAWRNARGRSSQNCRPPCMRGSPFHSWKATLKLLWVIFVCRAVELGRKFGCWVVIVDRAGGIGWG